MDANVATAKPTAVAQLASSQSADVAEAAAVAAPADDASDDMMEPEPEVLHAAEVADPEAAAADDDDDAVVEDELREEAMTVRKRGDGMQGIMKAFKAIVLKGRALDKMIHENWVCFESGQESLKDLQASIQLENPLYELSFIAPPPNATTQVYQPKECYVEDCICKEQGMHIGCIQGCGECAVAEQQKQDSSGTHISVQVSTAGMQQELKDVGKKMAHILKNWAARQPLSSTTTGNNVQGGLEMTQLLAAYSRAHGVVDLRRYGCKKASELLKKVSAFVKTGPHPTRPTSGLYYCWAEKEDEKPAVQRLPPPNAISRGEMGGAVIKLIEPQPGMPEVCPKCAHTNLKGAVLEWSDFAEGAYANGWHCEHFKLCQGRRSTMGDWRWFCKACQYDTCDKCVKDPDLQPKLQAMARRDLMFKRLRELVEKTRGISLAELPGAFMDMHKSPLDYMDAGFDSVIKMVETDRAFVVKRGATDRETLITIKTASPDRRRRRSDERGGRRSRSRDRGGRDYGRGSDNRGSGGYGGSARDYGRRDDRRDDRRDRDRDRRDDRRDRRDYDRDRDRRDRDRDRRDDRRGDRRDRDRDRDRRDRDGDDEALRIKDRDHKDKKEEVDEGKKRKEFAAKLREWQRAYAEKHGRQPTQADVDADPSVAGLYKEYVALKATKKDREKKFSIRLDSGTKLGLNLDSKLVIEQVNPKGAASSAGLEVGWRILQVNSSKVSTQNDLRSALKDAGNSFSLTVDCRAKEAD